MGVGAVCVEELHLARLSTHRAELFASAKGFVNHVAIRGASQFGAHKGRTLAGLDVLKLDDLIDGAVDFDVVAIF